MLCYRLSAIQVLALSLAILTTGVARGEFLDPLLINGSEVSPSDWGMVVNITSDRPDHCTGTVIGPRVIITAASCNKANGTATFTVGSTTYHAKMTPSDLWPGKEHDLSLGLTDQDITGVTPASVGGTFQTGMALTNLGYGCTDGDNPTFDDKLRMGPTAATGTKDPYVITGNGGSVSNSSYICYHDNGGPAFLASRDAKKTLFAVNSFGDRKTKNYAVRLDIPQSKDFFTKFLSSNNNPVICGVNDNGAAACNGGGPTPGAATCNLVAQPSEVVVGGNVTLVLTTQNATSATLDNQPVTLNGGSASKTITTSTVGSVHVQATVSGTGGNGSCSTDYNVKPTGPDPGNAPLCSITAVPQSVTAGDPVTLTLTVTSGTADFASIDGTEVPRPVGSLPPIHPQNKGDFSVTGFVRNAQGSHNCFGWYHVDDNGGNPNIPNFAVIPTYCGDNTANSDVRTVCISLVKKDATITDLRFNQALFVTYKNNTQEAMPILAHVPSGPTHTQEGQVEETLEMFPGGTIPADKYQALDMREATLDSQARRSVRDSQVPLSIVGYTATGQGFNVPSLNALGRRR